MVETNKLQTLDIEKDLNNPQLSMLSVLVDKLNDEIVARLSELAEQKVGRLTFHFAGIKLDAFENEIKEFEDFIEKNRFREKRNYDISHKELPEKWSDHKSINIPYSKIVVAIAKALELMKKIDDVFLGPSAKYLWQEMRRKRYKSTYPVRVSYMLLPYFWLSHDIRGKIIQEEMKRGMKVWDDMKVKVNGVETTIKACGKWGAIILGRQLMILDESFVELSEISFPTKQDDSING